MRKLFILLAVISLTACHSKKSIETVVVGDSTAVKIDSVKTDSIKVVDSTKVDSLKK